MASAFDGEMKNQAFIRQSEYWDERVERYGHTGWANGTIYAFDQAARLKAIRAIIDSIQAKKDVALDFGTGLGDFANLLGEQFRSVLAFDISKRVISVAQKRYPSLKNVQFIHGTSIRDVGITDASVQLVLSVTVLGHIVDDLDLVDTLNYLHRILTEDGYLIALEYAPLNPSSISKSYQRSTSFQEWIDFFNKCGFQLEYYYGFYHPIECPCHSYGTYRRNLGVRILAHFAKRPVAKKVLSGIAMSLIQQSDDFFWEGNEQDPLKIMVLKKG